MLIRRLNRRTPTSTRRITRRSLTRRIFPKIKCLRCCLYPFSWIGVIVALLGSHDSKFAAFHVKQALKLTVVNTLLGLCAGILCWTVIVPIAAGVCPSADRLRRADYLLL